MPHEHDHTGHEQPAHDTAHEHAEHSGHGGGHDSHGGGHDGGHGGGHADHAGHHEHMAQDFKRRFLVSLVLTIPIAALSPMLGVMLGYGGYIQVPGQMYILLGLSSLVFFYGGWPFLTGLVSELRKGQPGMMTLIALAITVAYVYSALVALGLQGKVFFWELASLIDVMLLGHWIEMRSVMSASGAVKELAKLMPDTAHRLTDGGSTEDVPVDQLAKGDRVLVKPGEKVPADGKVLEGRSSVDESMVTGESRPATKTEGNEVVGGTINGDGSLTVEVQKVGTESFLSQVVAMVEEAQQGKSRAQSMADRAAMWLFYVALTCGVATLAAWLLLTKEDFVFALERSVTVMVITCPHALGLAIPLVVAISTSIAANHGFLIRNRTAFEQARKLDTVMFDKTGTLTRGEFEVSDLVPFADISEAELAGLAAAVEAFSEHPIAKAVAGKTPDHPKADNFENIPGKGARATVNGAEVLVVSRRYLQDEGIAYPEDRVQPLEEQGKTLVFVLRGGEALGVLGLDDVVREESRRAVAELKKMGVRVVMITGDNAAVAERVAGELKLDEYFAEVLPDQKVAKVKEVQEGGHMVAMTGDGVNDAPALAQADVGIAIGAGTDVAVETADIVLVRSNPMDVVAILKLSEATSRKFVQNLFWATGYNVLAIPLAAGALASWGILLSPAVGAVFMSLSTVIVAVNARLLSYPEQAEAGAAGSKSA